MEDQRYVKKLKGFTWETFNHMPIYTDLRQITIWEVINQKLKSLKNESSVEAGS